MIDFGKIYLYLLVPTLLRYVFIAIAVHHYFWRRRGPGSFATKLALKAPQAEHIWREARTALSASLIYSLPMAVLFHRFFEGGTAMYWGMPAGLWQWLWIPGAILLLLILHDAYFYWTHRVMHHPALYRTTHQTHHISKQPTAFASFAFHPWEALISSWFIPAVAYVVPMHVGSLIAFAMLATTTAVLNHAGWEVWPRRFLDGPVGRWLITARHHNLHHTKFQRNYGLYFRFWDVAMGTDDLSGDPMARAAARPVAPSP